MNPNHLPAGHVLSRRLALAAVAAAVLAVLIWFYASKVQSGDVASWYDGFKYEQDSLFNKLFYAWQFPWD